MWPASYVKESAFNVRFTFYAHHHWSRPVNFCDRRDAKWTGDCFLSPLKVAVSYQSKIWTSGEVAGASVALLLSKWLLAQHYTKT